MRESTPGSVGPQEEELLDVWNLFGGGAGLAANPA